MQQNIPIEKILKKCSLKGVDFAEVFIEKSNSVLIVEDNKKIENVQNSLDAGIGIRVMHNQEISYGSTNDWNNIFNLAEKVCVNAIKPTHNNTPFKLNKISKGINSSIKFHPQDVNIKKKIAEVVKGSKTAWGLFKEIKQVKVLYKDKVRKIEIASTDGNYCSDEQIETVFLVQVIAVKNGIIQTGYEPIAGTKGFELFDSNMAEKIAILAATRAKRMLEAIPAISGPMPVILSSEAGGTMIHEAVGHGLEADLAKDGLSVYAGRIGKKVASELITVYDDATIQGKRGTFNFDDEGVPASKTCLIKDGILKQYLMDKTSALKKGLKSTGNGRRESFKHPPIVRMTNTLIAQGKDNPEDILKNTNTGLFVTRMGGGQVNTVNGDFTFDIQEAYRIENGKKGEPVRGATLIGNGPKVLEIIDKVGTDLGFSIGTCGKNGQEVPVGSAQPTIRIPEMIVGGKQNAS